MEKVLSLRNFPRAIMHMDGDAFFASVEVAKDPTLRGKPVVVGGERGIASAFSYEAKALGIFRGMPTYQIRKKFPEVVVLSGDYESYALYSKKMFDIVRRYTEEVEEYSIDECFADLTGVRRFLGMTYREILENIKKDVEGELDLGVSLGLAPTKVLAKVASKWRKPKGLTLIPGKEAGKFLSEVPIEKVWGVGPNTSTFLIKKGVRTAYDLATKDETWIKIYLSKPFIDIWNELNCRSVYSIDPKSKDTYSSISRTRTFHPATNDKDFLFSQISKHTEEVCAKARYFGLAAKKVSVFLKTQDFRFHKCDISLTSPANVPESVLYFVRKEFSKMHKDKVLYRTTGVTLHDLVSQEVKQGDLFGETEKLARLSAVHSQIDELEEKFGSKVVYLASTHKALKRKKDGKEFNDKDRHLLFL